MADKSSEPAEKGAEVCAEPDPRRLMLSATSRIHVEDQKVDHDLVDTKLSNHQLVRLVAKERRFTRVDFKYSTFDACYFRKCTFDSCDFTGCRFIGSNFTGSQFEGCIFNYSSLERTIVTSDLLQTCCPAHENLKMKFSRALRINFQQLGDADSANAPSRSNSKRPANTCTRRGIPRITITARIIPSGSV